MHAQAPTSTVTASTKPATAFDRAPVFDVQSLAVASPATVAKEGKRLVRALRDVGLVRVRVGDAAVRSFERATALGGEALRLLAALPDLQVRF